MSNELCSPFEACAALPGKLLIVRTVQGPPLASELTEFPFGDFSMHGGSIHPYFHLSYNQNWIPKEACHAPVRSIMGLAPMESITTDFRYREQVDYVRLVQEGMESSEVKTHTQNKGRELVDTSYNSNTVEMSPIKGLFGNSFWDVFDFVATVATGGANKLIETGVEGIDSIFGSDDGGGEGEAKAQPLNETILTTIDETLDSIQSSESHHTLTETTTSKSVLVERSISRTFSNPYKDRSLELRFIPVFRHFEVVTYLSNVDFGVLFDSGNMRFPNYGVGARHGDFLQKRIVDPRIISLANAELGMDDDTQRVRGSSAVSDHLNANASFYTKRFLLHAQDQRDMDLLKSPVMQLIKKMKDRKINLADALAWSHTQVRDKFICVPMTDLGNALSAMKNLPENTKTKFKKKMTDTILNPIWKNKFTKKKDVYLFMGTHVEAVPGNCILPNIP